MVEAVFVLLIVAVAVHRRRRGGGAGVRPSPHSRMKEGRTQLLSNPTIPQLSRAFPVNKEQGNSLVTPLLRTPTPCKWEASYIWVWRSNWNNHYAKYLLNKMSVSIVRYFISLRLLKSKSFRGLRRLVPRQGAAPPTLQNVFLRLCGGTNHPFQLSVRLWRISKRCDSTIIPIVPVSYICCT